MRCDIDCLHLRFLIHFIRPNTGERASLVDDIDGLVGQLSFSNELRGELGGDVERLIAVAHIMVFLIFRAQALEDFDGFGNCGSMMSIF